MLDDGIDRVAREMTAGRPRAGFADRVARRVAELEARRDHRSRPGLVLVPSAALVAGAVVVVLMFSRTRPPAPLQVLSSRTLATGAIQFPSGIDRPAPAEIVFEARDRAIRRTQSPDGEAPRNDRTGLEPLSVSPIDIQPLQVAAMDGPEPLVIDPIPIERIEVAALQP
jgi:hypothetical protein